ncbi:MAG: ABC transporter substrate-binding protein [Clostridiales bacterium]|nr:ABC transporter substrate-binding protein [Clostridiales bacterium]
MKNLRKSVGLVLALALLLPALFAFAQTEIPKIGIVQIMEHPALDAARQGFLDEMAKHGYEDGKTMAVDYRSAQGNPDILASIADHFVSENVTMVLAISTPAAQAVAGKTQPIPILGTAITDYVSARLAESNEKPGYNVSGTNDLSSIADQIDLLIRLVPDAKTIGVLYTSSEDNSVIQSQIAKDYIESKGLAYVDATVHNANDVQQATLSIMDRCDAVYIPTDNTYASAMPIVYEVAVAAKKVVVCGDTSMVMGGGIATLAINYYKLGEQTALMAIDVLNGADISTMPIQSQKEYEYVVNKTMADAVGLTIPEDLVPYAQDME